MILLRAKPLKVSIAILLLTLLSACATRWLTKKEEYIHDDISGFYKTADSTSLVIIGRQRHYVFPLEADLSSALAWEKRNELDAKFDTFQLGKDNTITGDYELSVSLDQLSPSEKTALAAMGFSPKKDRLALSRTLSGRVYTARDGTVPSGFKHPYRVTIARDVSRPAAVKYALSPIAVAVDGTLFLGGLVLINVGCVVKGIFMEKCF